MSSANTFKSLRDARESLARDGFCRSRLYSGFALGEVWVDPDNEFIAMIRKVPFASRWFVKMRASF